VVKSVPNNSTELAEALVSAILKIGTQHVVICPGSRSAPLSWQFAALAADNRITLHTRIDEREAGFLALGLAKATRLPVPVVVTSGTAVANLLPAVVEAYHSGIPLVILSADRPAQVRGKSSPQATWQVGMFNNFVKAELDIAKPTPEIDSILRSSITGHFGPVQINAQFDLPLLPENLTTRLDLVQVEKTIETSKTQIEIVLPAHGLLIVGDTAPSSEITQLEQLAITAGYPIIWEPTSQLHSSVNALSHGALLLQTGKMPAPQVIITAGLVGLSRSVLATLKSAPRHIAIHLASAGADDPDPVNSATEILTSVPKANVDLDPEWLNVWKQKDKAVSQIVQKNLTSQTLTGPSAALEVWNNLDEKSKLFIAASWPVRHLELYAPTRLGLTTFGNRGVNGIDGLISSACGVALASENRTYLLTGDIAFLHGMGGLNISADNQIPNCTVIVLDNNGSGIFSQLEQGSPKYVQHFEKVFGTPHDQDLWVIAEALGVPAVRVTTKSELNSAIERTNKIPGMHVIVCLTGNRQDEKALIEKIATETAQALH